MKCTIVFMNNGESYEDDQSIPVVVCANKEIAMQYIDTHPITSESFKKVFQYDRPQNRGKYFFEEVQIYTGK